MAKSNAQKCKDYRKSKKAKGRTLSLPLPPGTDKALRDLMRWHDHEDDREAIATFIHQLHARGPDGSREALATLPTDKYEPSEEMVQRLVVEGSRIKAEPEPDWR